MYPAIWRHSYGFQTITVAICALKGDDSLPCVACGAGVKASPLLQRPLMKNDGDCGGDDRLNDSQRNPKYVEETCPSAVLFTTEPTWVAPGFILGRNGGKQSTNRLSYGTARKLSSAAQVKDRVIGTYQFCPPFGYLHCEHNCYTNI